MAALRLPRLGLQGRMAASYVLVTAAAVVIVEAIAIAAVLPALLSQFDLDRRVSVTAALVAATASQANASSTTLTLPRGYLVGDPGVDPSTVRALGSGIAVPQVDVGAGLMPTVGVLIDTDGLVLASSYPLRYPIGRSGQALVGLGKLVPGSGTSDTAEGTVTWALVPILYPPDRQDPAQIGGKIATNKVPGKGVVGWAYVQAPGTALTAPGPLGFVGLAPLAGLPDSSVGPLLRAGAALLLLLVPLGTAFGMWTSRRMVSRLAALAGATGDFATGDLDRRVGEGAVDEVGQVERGFNTMAARIQRMTTDRARLADERARTEERARIARELHDSISQDLFSIGLIAGGLQRALPEVSPLQPEIVAMRDTIEGTMSEMRALLLELRPAALDERGLIPALSELCAAYQERLGVIIDARLEPIEVAPPADVAVLRVAQEGIANAVRHADARHIELHLARRDGRTELIVADDGRGFDESTATGYGLGLRVMRERIRELGGSLVIHSQPGRGTRVEASLP